MEVNGLDNNQFAIETTTTTSMLAGSRQTDIQTLMEEDGRAAKKRMCEWKELNLVSAAMDAD